MPGETDLDEGEVDIAAIRRISLAVRNHRIDDQAGGTTLEDVDSAPNMDITR
jgi:hypothetical protein